VVIGHRKGLHSHMSSIANVPQHLCDMRIIDLARARFMSAGYIRDMNVAQTTCSLTDEFGNVALFDLSVVNVQQQPDSWTIHLLDQSQAIFDERTWISGMVDFGVHDFKAEKDVMLLGQFSQPA